MHIAGRQKSFFRSQASEEERNLWNSWFCSPWVWGCCGGAWQGANKPISIVESTIDVVAAGAGSLHPSQLAHNKSISSITKITKEVEALRDGLRIAVEHAVNIGELLLQAKAEVQHGQWGKWLEEHVPLTERQAQKYLRLARKREELEKSNPNWNSDLTIDQALESLRPAPRQGRKRKSGPRDDPAGYRRRCKRLQRIKSGGEDLNRTDNAALKAVQANRFLFQHKVVEAARRCARKLCEKAGLRGNNADPEFLAMLFCDELKIDPVRAFDPVSVSVDEQPQTDQQPRHRRSEGKAPNPKSKRKRSQKSTAA